MQFHITNLVGPIDITDLTETAVVKDVNLSHITFHYSPALGTIQKDGLNVVVVKPDLGLRLCCSDFQMLRSRLKAPLAIVRRAWMSLWAPLSLLMRLPRYVKSSMHSSDSPLIVIGDAVGALTNITLVFFWLMCRPVRFAKLLSRLDFCPVDDYE